MSTHITRTRWVDVCALDDIWPDGGEAALVGRLHVALLRVGATDVVYAIDNFDPFSKSYTLARGTVSERDGLPEVASPVYRRCFSLLTGECLDDASVKIGVYATRVRAGRLELQVPAHTLDSFESIESIEASA
jgi:nitrite reductase (NADH) small subunit